MTDQPSRTPTRPGNSPGFLLWRTTLRWQRSITVALQPLELTHVQFVVLAGVWWLGGQAGRTGSLPSQRQLADHAGIDVMMTSQVVRALDGRGLLTREGDPDDARLRRLAVTTRGRRLAEQAIAVVDAADAEFFGQLSEPAQLMDSLRRLAEAP